MSTREYNLTHLSLDAAYSYNSVLALGTIRLFEKLKEIPLIGNLAEHIQSIALTIAEDSAKSSSDFASGKDHLTGLDNRKGLIANLTRQLDIINRISKDACAGIVIYVIDINDFKSVNDSLGHSTGDEVIRNIANILQHPRGDVEPRDTDFPARWGGDEFVIVGLVTSTPLPNTDDKLVTSILEKMQQLKTEYTAKYPGKLNGSSITISVGRQYIELCNIRKMIDDGMGFDEIFEKITHQADNAMYLAKEKSLKTHNNEFVIL